MTLQDTAADANEHFTTKFRKMGGNWIRSRDQVEVHEQNIRKYKDSSLPVSPHSIFLVHCT